MNWTWQSFGRQLIVSEDLDPVYVFAANANINDNTLKRFLLAYFCYYSAGVSARIAESKDFYETMRMGLDKPGRYPRGFERRYFYGKQAANTIDGLEDYGEPEAVIDRMTIHNTFAEASAAVQEFYGFGPWMSWKIADVSERILAIPIDFSESTLGIYRDPVQGAAFVRFGDKSHPITEEELDEVVRMQVEEYADLLAPPFYDRPINIQESETILCKGKASNHGFYPMGNDTYHVREALKGYGDLAEEFLRWCPQLRSEWLGADGKLRRDRKVEVKEISI